LAIKRVPVATLTLLLLVALLAGDGLAVGNCTIFKTFGNEVLTASDLNQSLIQAATTNSTTTCIDDYSATTTQMQSATDPFPAGAESLATSLAGELERLRFQIQQLHGQAQWYARPVGGLAPTGTLVPYSGTTAPTGWLLADGSAVSRTTYAALFAVATFTQAATLNTGSAVVTGLTTTNMRTGMALTGTGVPASTTILTVDSGTAITMSANATATGSQTLRFYPYGAGDQTTTFNLPNLTGRVPVGRDATQPEFDTLAESGGAKTHTLTIAELPAHNHTLTDPGHVHSINYQQVANIGSGVSNPKGGDDGGFGILNTPVAVTGITLGSTGGGAAHNTMPPYITLTYLVKI
jgi:microcystin-dependent protein